MHIYSFPDNIAKQGCGTSFHKKANTNDIFDIENSLNFSLFDTNYHDEDLLIIFLESNTRFEWQSIAVRVDFWWAIKEHRWVDARSTFRFDYQCGNIKTDPTMRQCMLWWRFAFMINSIDASDVVPWILANIERWELHLNQLFVKYYENEYAYSYACHIFGDYTQKLPLSNDLAFAEQIIGHGAPLMDFWAFHAVSEGTEEEKGDYRSHFWHKINFVEFEVNIFQSNWISAAAALEYIYTSVS